MNKSPFSARAVLMLISCVVILFSLSVILSAFDGTPETGGNRSGPGAFSVSALGCAGLYDLLKSSDWQTRRSLGHSLAAVGSDGTLILAEPDTFDVVGTEEVALLRAPRTLLVLPKWRGVRDPARKSWVSRVEMVPPDRPRRLLDQVAQSEHIRRESATMRWTTNVFGIDPTIDHLTQLMSAEGVRPLVASDSGVLLGEIQEGNRVVWILADPDVMANHGIGKGDNAAFMLAVIGRLAAWRNGNPNAPVVFDETVHGFSHSQGSVLQLLFRFPFGIVTALVGLSALLLVGAGAGRFGVARRAKASLDFGKTGLIRNSARLLDYSGHQASVLRRYVDLTIRSAGQSLHAPLDLTDGRLAEWLDRIGKARGIQSSAVAIRSRSRMRVDAKKAPDAAKGLLACAQEIHQWKEDILHGFGTDRRDNQRHQD